MDLIPFEINLVPATEWLNQLTARTEFAVYIDTTPSTRYTFRIIHEKLILLVLKHPVAETMITVKSLTSSSYFGIC